MTLLNVLHFIWTSHIKCLSRIDFEVVSRNFKLKSRDQVIQTDHGLKTQTLAQPSLPKQLTTPGSRWFSYD